MIVQTDHVGGQEAHGPGLDIPELARVKLAPTILAVAGSSLAAGPIHTYSRVAPEARHIAYLGERGIFTVSIVGK